MNLEDFGIFLPNSEQKNALIETLENFFVGKNLKKINPSKSPATFKNTSLPLRKVNQEAKEEKEEKTLPR